MRIGLICFIPFLLLHSCKGDGSMGNKMPSSDTVHLQKEAYTCSMHPQVVQNHAGTCPICGMDLVKLTESRDSLNTIMLSDTQLMLGNITTGRAARRSVGETVIINGKLTINEKNTRLVGSRAEGRIEKLYIKETGMKVEKGEPLYVLYSETLLTLQQEYLLAKDHSELSGQSEGRYKTFFEAAERKLRLYGLTTRQIANLAARRTTEPRVTFFSPDSGIVTDIRFSEGQYVPEGGTIYRLEDMSTLWVEAELFANEASLVQHGDKITVTAAGYEAASFEATVTFLSPEYRANSQVTVMRAEIANPELRLKPGQQVAVSFINSARRAIAVPLNAVIRNEDGTHVYVQEGLNSFQPRMVATGLEGLDFVEITKGLREGDTIAVTGAYLLYSQIVLKKGADPMAGHNH